MKFSGSIKNIITDTVKFIPGWVSDYKKIIVYTELFSGQQASLSDKMSALSQSFKAQGAAIKNWWSNLSGLSKFSIIATGVILAVQGIEAVIDAVSESWDEKVARLEMEITVNDEEIKNLTLRLPSFKICKLRLKTLKAIKLN